MISRITAMSSPRKKVSIWLCPVLFFSPLMASIVPQARTYYVPEYGHFVEQSFEVYKENFLCQDPACLEGKKKEKKRQGSVCGEYLAALEQKMKIHAPIVLKNLIAHYYCSLPILCEHQESKFVTTLKRCRKHGDKRPNYKEKIVWVMETFNISKLQKKQAGILHYLAKIGDKKLVECFKKDSINLTNVDACDASGSTPLHLSILGDHPDVAAQLIAPPFNANVNAKDSEGLFPLFMVCDQILIKGRKEIALSLLQRPDLEVGTTYRGMTPLYALLKNPYKEVLLGDVIKKILAHPTFNVTLRCKIKDKIKSVLEDGSPQHRTEACILLSKLS